MYGLVRLEVAVVHQGKLHHSLPISPCLNPFKGAEHLEY